jgi:general secretion pathway protein G
MMLRSKKDGLARGFTIIEMLVVLGMIAILASLVLTGVHGVRLQAKKTKARHDVEQIATAWGNYLQEYRRFPKTVTVTKMDSAALSILRGETAGPDNPQRLTFMEFKSATTNYADPWGSLYEVALDQDLDNKVTVPGLASPLYRSVAVWSKGPDGVAGTKDDIRSWQR